MYRRVAERPSVVFFIEPSVKIAFFPKMPRASSIRLKHMAVYEPEPMHDARVSLQAGKGSIYVVDVVGHNAQRIKLEAKLILSLLASHTEIPFGIRYW
jgi:hypothetical protein